jgi:RHS repeat-associated protein
VKTKRHLTTAAVIALSVFTHTGHAVSELPAPKPEFLNREQLVKWNTDQGLAKVQKTAGLENSESKGGVSFFTGKPFEADSGSYLFKYRAYDSELNRWTTADPSGFPDGANNKIYCSNPISEIDPLGLWEWSVINDKLQAAIDDALTMATSNFAGTVVGLSTFDLGQYKRLEASLSNINVTLNSSLSVDAQKSILGVWIGDGGARSKGPVGDTASISPFSFFKGESGSELELVQTANGSGMLTFSAHLTDVVFTPPFYIDPSLRVNKINSIYGSAQVSFDFEVKLYE